MTGRRRRKAPDRGPMTSSSLDITPVVPSGKQLINGYGDGAFKVSGVQHAGAVLVFPDRTVPWDAVDAAGLLIEHFRAVIDTAETVDIVLLGCGAVFVPPPKGLRPALKDHGLALEWMDTGAACRTYNVLLGEDRPIVAALLPVT